MFSQNLKNRIKTCKNFWFYWCFRMVWKKGLCWCRILVLIAFRLSSKYILILQSTDMSLFRVEGVKRTLFPNKLAPILSFFRHNLRSRIQKLRLENFLMLLRPSKTSDVKLSQSKYYNFFSALCWGPQKRLNFWSLDL